MTAAPNLDHETEPYTFKVGTVSRASLRVVTHTPASALTGDHLQESASLPTLPTPVKGAPYVVAVCRYDGAQYTAALTEDTSRLTWWAESGLSRRLDVYRCDAPFGESTPQERASIARGEVPADRRVHMGRIEDGRIGLTREVNAQFTKIKIGRNVIRCRLMADGEHYEMNRADARPVFEAVGRALVKGGV